ncbi:MAG: clostripain-related cysteine peptidase, partial [Bacteroides sp.]|uniref:clostripain-related cysteine peptidase n=1 Tax=Bacteroides sp. TaxID=29523 RepID=UPI002FC6CDED
ADSYPEKVVNSRATVFDDNTGGESISIFEQEEAFKRANVKLDLLYWDVCLMHNMENICQIKDYTRYVMGAAHLTAGVGGNYALLMNLLENNSNLMDAMKEYIPAMVKHWVSGEDVDDQKLAKDLAISDMKYVDEVAQNMKQCVSSLIKYRDGLEPGSAKELQYYQFNGTAQVGQKGPYPYYSSTYGKLYYFYYNANSVDMLSAFSRIATAVLDGQMTADVAKLKLSVDKMIPISHCAGTPNFLNRVSLGINWIDKKVFEAVHPELPIPTLEGLYSKLRFEQMVGWSRFLKTNNMYRMPTENQPSGSVQ